MEENASKGLSLTATIFLTIGLITIAVSIYFIAVAGTKTAQDDMSGLTNTLQQSKFSAYDNSIVSGSQIINVIRQYMKQDAFGVKVTTGKKSTKIYGDTFDEKTGEVSKGTKNDDLDDAQDQSSADYINPSGRFTSKVITDSNGVVRGIVFTQR